VTDRGQYSADLVVSALPCQEAARLFVYLDKEIAGRLGSIPVQGLQVAYLGYSAHHLNKPGFGYLIPSKEQQKVMGAIFDSAIFPQQNHHAQETRLTYMLRDEGQTLEESLERARSAAASHLQISSAPDFCLGLRAEKALPQYPVGHRQQMEGLKRLLAERLPRCHLLGNYLKGVSVSDCVAQSQELASEILY